jgi:hypothetical protein
MIWVAVQRITGLVGIGLDSCRLQKTNTEEERCIGFGWGSVALGRVMQCNEAEGR